ncbi:MAG: type II toxin-antitoxin system HicB family antitoxin [Deltaproteobacteria bacterium]|nr:type II toxin-antitoxin system HicB family antitoxin [Deltaproteobacteria bacterium]
MNILCKIEIFQEEGIFVAVAPELNVSIYGETVQDAKKSLAEALNAFFEECQNMGTLDEVLEESGFTLI